jgi:hypothetical protein
MSAKVSRTVLKTSRAGDRPAELTAPSLGGMVQNRAISGNTAEPPPGRL